MQIPAPHGHLEAHLRSPPEPRGVGAALLCHPHPQHGGTMHTKAVFRAAQGLNDAGLPVLRFNFRGVGTSTGSWGEGVGEKEDVRVALDWLAKRFPDVPLLLGGFSFGSIVGFRVGREDPRVRGLLGLGLPVTKYGVDFLEGLDQQLFVVQGEEDEFGSGEEVARALAPLEDRATLVRIPGADHYFNDHFDELRLAVRTHYADGAGAELFAIGGGASRPAPSGTSGATQ